MKNLKKTSIIEKNILLVKINIQLSICTLMWFFRLSVVAL